MSRFAHETENLLEKRKAKMNWVTFFTIISPVVVAIIGSVVAYFQAVKTSNIKIKELETQSKHELETIKELHVNELEKINAEVNAQVLLYEKNKQADLTLGMLEMIMKDPKGKGKLLSEFNKVFK